MQVLHAAPLTPPFGPVSRPQDIAKCFPETFLAARLRESGDESCAAAGYINSG